MVVEVDVVVVVVVVVVLASGFLSADDETEAETEALAWTDELENDVDTDELLDMVSAGFETASPTKRHEAIKAKTNLLLAAILLSENNPGPGEKRHGTHSKQAEGTEKKMRERVRRNEMRDDGC